MADLIIRRVGPGAFEAKHTSIYSILTIHRIERANWQQTPAEPGIYLLWGIVDGQATTYIGMSSKSIRDRIRQHHVAERKNWFGVIFVIPTPAAVCPAVEAELIRRVREAGVVAVVTNLADEARWLDGDLSQVEAAVEDITAALEMLIGSDIFTAALDDEGPQTVEGAERTPLLARVYKGQAEQPRQRADGDPAEATHSYVGAGIAAWGAFEGAEPDTRFRVIAGSAWRAAEPNPEQVSYAHQVRAERLQKELISAGVLEAGDEPRFARDHVFDNWSQATQVVSGKGQYSGAYHWQRLAP